MNKLTYLSAVVVALSLLFTGCDEFVSGYEDDPNEPQDAPEDLQLSGSQVALGLFYEAEGTRVANIYTDQFTGSDRQYTSYENYNAPRGEYNGPWGDAYSGVVQQMRIVQEKAGEINNRILQGIAQTMEAQVMGTVAGLWGDVPYDEAANVEEYPNPEYQPQAEVYNQVQNLLDEAIANLQSGEGVAPSSDIFFGGDPGLWLQVAHTLKARYYLHTGDYDLALAAAENGIDDPENSMIMSHDGGSYTGDLNIFYSFGLVDRVGYMTAEDSYGVEQFTARNNAKTDESERFAFYYADGNENGVVDDLNYGGFFGATASFPIVTYEENQLILAETELEANSDDQAAIDELNALRSHLANEFSDGEYGDYLLTDFAPGGIARDGASSTEEAIRTEIFEERYFSLLAQYEVFIDMQRSDNILGIEPNTGDELPKRFLYPQTEVNSNENTPEQSTSDLFTPLPVFDE